MSGKMNIDKLKAAGSELAKDVKAPESLNNGLVPFVFVNLLLS